MAIRKQTAGGQPRNSKPTTGDHLNINARLYNQLGRLLDDMEAADRDERLTMPQRIAALVAIGRIQVLFATLRKAEANDPSSAGSEVRRFSSAFAKTHGVDSRTPSSRGPELVDLDSNGDDDGDSPDAA